MKRKRETVKLTKKGRDWKAAGLTIRQKKTEQKD